ncbi:P63C domain-containing protein [Pasteurella multocida]|uniref:P63C domain-containing protein n=1 Tax=Pasteurella multocida TaxID=747 RepID=UPI00197D1545|nr:P63C domain-containing protein [Pasteurella multocida]
MRQQVINNEREKDELQQILRKYISEELLPWQKRFPDIFYKELFRLNGWDYTVKGIQKRPGVVGTWTNKLIYEQLPKGVLEELRNNIPKSESGNSTARYHQLLTDDIGSPHLTAQINQIVTLFQLSDNMKEMWNNFQKLKLRQSGQLDLPFSFDSKGHTKEN